MIRWFAIAGVGTLSATLGCSSNDGNGGSNIGAGDNSSTGTGAVFTGNGGSTPVGGSTSSGGSNPVGGSTATGGNTTINTGGTTTMTGGIGGTAGTGGTTTMTGGTGGTTGTGGASASGGTGGGALNACTADTDQTGCVGQRYEGEAVPLDIYIMFDQSCSMSCPAEQTGFGLCCIGGPDPRIDQVRSAMTTFLQDPLSGGIGVGIGYFGYMQAGQTSCDPSDYSRAAVSIDKLPGNATNLINSLYSVQPTGETPTGAAIRGACTYGAQWQAANPGHATVVLLVTDGVPEAPVTSTGNGCTPATCCTPTIEDAVYAAGTCYNHNPPLPVYVLGVGYQLDNLNQIAVAGGTQQAFLVQGADVSAAILDALNQIRALAQIPCELQVPPAPDGETLNYQQVNVGYCSASATSEIFYYVEDATQCDPAQGGWYYDDPNAPSHIELCGPTCDRVNSPGGSLFMSVGCDTQVLIR